MKIYYLYDGEEHRRLNSEGLDYTAAYIPQLAKYMGISANPISKGELGGLCRDDILIAVAQKLDTPPDCYTVYFDSAKDAPRRTKEVFAHVILGEERLPVFVPFVKPRTQGKIIAYAVDCDGIEIPAIVKGERSLEFCFDLAATVWFSEDGLLPEKLPGYFYTGRTPDTRPLDGLGQSAYNDILVGVLEEFLIEAGAAAIWRLPPTDSGTSPDAVMHISGDDDCSSRDFNLSAAKTMFDLGLPYHINAMPNSSRDAFVYDKRDYEKLLSYGCEVALHMNFIGVSYSLESLKTQVDLFTKLHGTHPHTNTNHCFIQNGSTAERLRWFEACGIVADNGKCGHFNPENINAFDLYGHTFGTAFPRFSLDDAEHSNAQLSTMEIPVTYYEPRIYKATDSTEKVVRYVDDMVRYGRFGQFFIHPHYLREGSPEREGALRAISTLRTRAKERGYNISYSTTNKIADFWLARANASVCCDGASISVKCDTPLLVRLPKSFCGKALTLDGADAICQEKYASGEKIYLVFVPAGAHKVALA
ncbi:MAG: hypothetical protein IJY65_00520 [Clostridia bacterium]|nr:hypothetical protein [Clostridia bacterium]